MKINSGHYYLNIVALKAGTFFLGVAVTEDQNYIITEDSVSSIKTEGYENSLTTEQQESILRCVKNLRIEQIQKEDDKNLMTAFEYPVGTGDTYDISRSQFSYYNSMFLFKDSFTYPFEFVGNNGASITLPNSTNLADFISLGLQKHQEIYNNRYLPAVNQINSITVDTDLITAINTVLSINY